MVSNDNKPHKLLKEFYFWQYKCGEDIRFPRRLYQKPFKEWDQIINNFIWFYKFECSVVDRIRRDNIRVISRSE